MIFKTKFLKKFGFIITMTIWKLVKFIATFVTFCSNNITIAFALSSFITSISFRSTNIAKAFLNQKKVDNYLLQNFFHYSNLIYLGNVDDWNTHLNIDHNYLQQCLVYKSIFQYPVDKWGFGILLGYIHNLQIKKKLIMFWLLLLY